jgi:hypothetical protein
VPLVGYLPGADEWQVSLRSGPTRWPPAAAADVAHRIRQLKGAIADMKRTQLEMPQTSEGFAALLHPQLQPEASMLGGQWCRYAQVWEEYARIYPEGQDEQWVLSSLKRGVEMEFCHPHAETKRREPMHAQKLAGVRKGLQEGSLSVQEIGLALQGTFPPSCWLGNRVILH